MAILNEINFYLDGNSVSSV